jgi:sugar-specific transcriptional regulator TrmB
LNGDLELSLERIFKTLVELGLSETDSRVYILISFKGPLVTRKIIQELKITKQQLYPVLKKLNNKKMIEISDSHPSVISAVPFEIILKMLIDSKIDEAKKVQEKKQKLISNWKAVSWNNHD